jgi:hypothetical protein
MAKTLEELIKEIPAEKLGDTGDGLKNLKKIMEKTKDEWDKAEEANKPDKKKEYETAEGKFTKARALIMAGVRNEINKITEEERRNAYPKEARQRMEKRSMARIEEDIKTRRVELDMLNLDRDLVKQEIDEIRKESVPA